MKPRNEELLNYLLWTCDLLTNPTFRNLTDSFEEWAYRNGLNRQLAELSKRRIIENEPGSRRGRGRPKLDRVIRLTEAGRLQALGGRDPRESWNREWDGEWRLALFDIPNKQAALRARLRRHLRSKGCGCLQESVWISPHSIDFAQPTADKKRIDAKSFLLLEGRPCGGESDEEIVAAAWDFRSINQAYTEYLSILAARPKAKIPTEDKANHFRKWAIRERAAWLKAASMDPFLPPVLQPHSYLGKEAWDKRVAAWRNAATRLRLFKPPS